MSSSGGCPPAPATVLGGARGHVIGIGGGALRQYVIAARGPVIMMCYGRLLGTMWS